MKAAGAGGGVFNASSFTDRRRPIPKWMWGAIGVSVIIHGAAGVWLYNRHFVMPEAVGPAPTDGPIILTMPPPPKPKPIENVKPQPASPAPIHKPPLTQTPTDTSPFKVVDKPVTNDDSLYVPIETTPQAETPKVEPEPARPSVIGNPKWLKKPNGDQMARYYPSGASAQGIEGSATIFCTVTAKGGLTGCSVVSETPADQGFGEAAQRLSKFFVMSPKTIDGAPVEGGQVKIPIRFNLS